MHRHSLLLRLLPALLLGLPLTGCPVGDDDDSSDPGVDGARAWIEISVESTDTANVLAALDRLTVTLQPLSPLVDADGAEYPAGPVDGTDLTFADVIPGDDILELVFSADTDGFTDAFPVLALDPGVNVPLGFHLIAQGYAADGTEVARAPRTPRFDLEDRQVLQAVIPNFALLEEPPTPTCQDGLDNDADGWTDLADPGCGDDPEREEQDGFGTNECNDGIDNADEDGLIDSLDPDCDDASGASEGDARVPTCQDGLDDDGDGWTDSADPDCSDPANDESGYGSSQCNDGNDNDNDGLTDGDDPDCTDAFDVTESTPVDPCADGFDNDNDGWQDAADPDCAATGVESGFGSTQCNNGLDDDGDFLQDGLDPDCDDALDDTEAAPICSNGLDDDGDGWIDDADPDCATGGENGVGSTECNDGVDNDSDGATDSADFQCADAADDAEAAACDDGLDNDGDGWLDLQDPAA